MAVQICHRVAPRVEFGLWRILPRLSIWMVQAENPPTSEISKY